MLGVFKNGVVSPPNELQSPASAQKLKDTEEILKDFLASNPVNGFSIRFPDHGFLACAPPQVSFTQHQRRLFGGVNDVYCIFLGSLNNLSALNKQYGLSKGSNEAIFVIEAYRTLRDRGPLPAHRVLQELDGSFGFVVYDQKSGNVFAALGSDKSVHLLWGISSDGSVIISDNVDLIKASCGKSFAPFPAGCMYHSERGLTSFEHPMNQMKAVPRIDSEGAIAGSFFAVDICSKINAMPRVGSEANWANWT